VRSIILPYDTPRTTVSGSHEEKDNENQNEFESWLADREHKLFIRQCEMGVLTSVGRA
jgi:hypothetical protein